MKKSLKKLLVTSMLVTFSLTTAVMFSGCGAKKDEVAKTPTVSDIVESVKGKTSIDELKEGDAQKLKKFYGLTGEELEDYKLYLPQSNLKAGELFVAKVKDKEKVDEVEKKINERLEKQKTGFKDYIPEEYNLLEKAVVEKKDNYVLFSVSKDSDKVKEAFDASFK